MSTEETFNLLNFLNEVFEGNNEYIEKMQEKLQEHVDGQDPVTTTVSCCDSRVKQEGMWGNEEIGAEFTRGTIGNSVLEYTHEGETTISGDVDYIPEHSETPTVAAVIGHTGCGAVTAAYETLEALEKDYDLDDIEIDQVNLAKYNGKTQGINTKIRLLINSGLLEDYKELKGNAEKIEEVDRLVERNVDNQVAELIERSDYTDTEFIGLVFDLDGMYEGKKGQLYLVNYCGEKSPETLEEKVSSYSLINAKRIS